MTTRTAQETALWTWLQSIVGTGTSYGATIIYTHPHAQEPTLPYVRLEVNAGAPYGHPERYLALDGNNDNVEHVIQHMTADVMIEIVADDSHSIAEEIAFRRELDGETLQAAGVSVTSLSRIGVQRVHLGDRWDARYFLEMEINYRQIYQGNEVYPVTTVVAEGDVGLITGVSFTTA